MDLGIHLIQFVGNKTKKDLEEIRKILYLNAIGFLMYLVQQTIPDIAFPVSYLSRFNTTYNSHHRKALIMVMRYLKKTADFCLVYTQEMVQVSFMAIVTLVGLPKNSTISQRPVIFSHYKEVVSAGEVENR